MTTLWKTLLLTMLTLTLTLTLLPGCDAQAATPTDLATASDAPEAEARDLTMACLLNGYLTNATFDQARDGSYRTFWESKLDHGAHQLIITPPEGEKAAGILIRWRSEPRALNVQVRDGDSWRTVASCGADFFAQYIELPDIGEEFRLVRADDPAREMQICEISVWSPGVLPEDVQLWQQPPETVDMMLLVGHPDDEVLWFGGLLPTYAGEREKSVLVVLAAPNLYNRRLELLDSLWTCGVNIYPVICGYPDICTNDMNTVYDAWRKTVVQGDITALYRRYRPKVVVLHDVKGEYGHGVHRVMSDAGRKAAEYANDPEKFPESAAEYGLWDVPKVYVHLLADNQITMDWHQPLERFGGMTGQDVAREAFKCHVSQQGKRWQVEDGGIWDNSLFGLWRTTVGPDVEKNDLFEHME